jgi:peptidoglycan/LPS O-acetylase OafA/YrhL
VIAPRHSSGFRSDIEGLRAIAILLVVACHCGISWCAGGFIGVDVFFVLSGYLITGLLVAEIRRTSRIDLPRFYARRARRLFPALLLVLLMTLAAALVIQAPGELNFTGRAARATALYVSNIFFDINAANYFAPDVESNPFLHTWSLGVEEQFYLFWPVLVILGMRSGGASRALAALMSGGAVVSLVFCIWSTAHYPTTAFYQLPARAWEFALGGLLACARLPKLGAVVWTAVGWMGLAAVFAAAYLLQDDSGFPGWVAIIPALGTVAVLAAGAALPQQGVCILLDARPMQYIGARSYSWYLWHWPFIVFSVAVVPGIPVAAKVIIGSASLGAAALTYRFLEQPVRHDPQLAGRTAFSLVLAGATATGTAALALLVIRLSDGLASRPLIRPIVAASADVADMAREKCVSLGQSTAVRTCTFGDLVSPTEVVLFGDSHALQWFNALERLARESGWRLVTVIKPGCAASDIQPIMRSPAVCDAWRAQALETIIRRHPALVVVGSFTSRFGQAKSAQSDSELKRLTLGTRAMLDRLTRAGLNVALLRDTPLPPFDVPTCLERSTLHHWLGAGSCEFDREAAMNARVFAAEKGATEGMPGVHILDLTDQICPARVCPAILHNLIVYRDRTHLTGTFAGSLAPTMGRALTEAVASSR